MYFKVIKTRSVDGRQELAQANTMHTKPRRSVAWSRALAAVENMPDMAGDVRSRNVFIGYRRTSVRFDAPT
jgi:hypothetical protein